MSIRLGLLSNIGLTVPAIAGSLLLLAPSARASDISYLDSFGNVSYQQTGNGNTVSLNGAFFSADVNTNVPDPYTSVSMVFPGALSPIGSFSLISPQDYHYQTSLYGTLAAMEADFPFGTYTFTSNTGDSASYDYLADDYTTSIPYLTGSEYTDLQGVNSSMPFTFTFSPFVTGSHATDSFIFFTIYDETLGETVFGAGFLPATTTSVLVAGGTLNPGDLFDYEIDYSNRDIPVPPSFFGGDFPPQLGFDVRTDGLFTTAPAAATPEPATTVLFGLGLFAATAFRRRLSSLR